MDTKIVMHTEPGSTEKVIYLSLLLIMVILLLWGYFDTLIILYDLWSGKDITGYTHGFLVFICSLYLIYQKKDRIQALSPKPNWWAVVPLSGSSILWFTSVTIDVQVIQLALLPVIIMSVIAMLFGNKMLKIVFIPVFILFFALPIWQPMSLLLQDITTVISHNFMRLIEKPVFVQGNTVYLPGGTFIIEESCSGLRFLLVSLTLTLINSNLNQHSYRQGAILLLLIVFLALLANWTRVVAILLIGDYTRMQHSLVRDHMNFGWMVYLLVTLLPYLFLSRFVKAPEFENVNVTRQVNYPPLMRGLSVFALLYLSLLAGPLLAMYFDQPGRIAPGSLSIPSAIAPWKQVVGNRGNRLVEWTPFYAGASQELYADFSKGNEERVSLQVIYYNKQEQGAELINVENSLVDDTNWVYRIKPQIQSLEGRSAELEAVLAAQITSRQGQNVLVWYWFNVGGMNTISNSRAKIYQAIGLFRNRADAALFVLSAPCSENCSAEELLLGDYMNEMGDALVEVTR